MTIDYLRDLVNNSETKGHRFLQPALWYQHQVEAILKPLSSSPLSYTGAVEIAQKICRLPLFLFSHLVLPIIGVSFFLGLAIKHYNFVPPTPPREPTPIVQENKPPTTLKTLKDKMEAIFNDLSTIHQSAGQELEQLIQEFNNTTGQNPLADVQEIKQFNLLQSTFLALKQMRQGLFMMEFKVGDDGVMKVADDGNCFFHAILNGLGKHEENLQRKIPLNHQALRQQVVQWMRENLKTDATLRCHIQAAIEAYSAARRALNAEELLTLNLLEEEKQDVSVRKEELEVIEKEIRQMNDPQGGMNFYLGKMEQHGFFASVAEMYAVSQMFGVAIHVERKIGGCNIGEWDAPVNPSAPHQITLIHQDGKHFNLKVFSQEVPEPVE